MKLGVTVLALSFLALGCTTAPRSREPQPELSKAAAEALTSEDLTAIYALAEQLGFGPVDRVWGSVHTLPSSCTGGVTLGAETIGQDSTWIHSRQLALHREGVPCPVIGMDRVTVGGWESSKKALDEDTQRRLSLREGHIDVWLGEGVSFDTAARLVSAVESGLLEGSGRLLADEIEAIDAVPLDDLPDGHLGGPEHRLYEIATSGSRAFTVCDEGTRLLVVEVFAVMW